MGIFSIVQAPFAALALLLLGALPDQGALQREQDTPQRPLDLAGTEAIVRAYQNADGWSLKAIVLLSLGPDFHPTATSILLSALRDKDERLRPYAVEVLRGMDSGALEQVAAPELVGELIDETLRTKSKLLHERTLDVLRRMMPDSGATDRAEWQRWWSLNKKTYAPPAWVPPRPPDPSELGRTVAGAFVERAFDLHDAGLDVAIVIDSTGSMQRAIDAARDAIGDVVALLANVAPKLRLGLVHYKDRGELGAGGAEKLASMTKDQDEVRDKLAHLSAVGGGDLPEAVDKGIELALDEDMKWNKEANRLILVIGDAPPHPENEKALLELVKRAHDEPFAKPHKGPTTGAAKPSTIRPFITSTIATSPGAVKSFAEIAKAGGGTSVQLDMAPAAARGADGKPAAPVFDDAAAARKVVQHILLLSFGPQYRAQLEQFVEIFFEYRDDAAAK